MNLSQHRIGICGSGFIAQQLLRALHRTVDLVPGFILTRRNPSHVSHILNHDCVTSSLGELVETSQLIVECSGDPRLATDVVTAAFQQGLPVVTMNTEFHVSCGSSFIEGGYLTEAEGDQPGSLAALVEDALAMGFRPLVLGNMKGFLNFNPSVEEMLMWSERLGISLAQVTSFTDGTKLQMEQALVANGLGATIVKPGLMGLQGENVQEATSVLASLAIDQGKPISDYLLHSGLPPGVFVVCTHDSVEAASLKHYKLGNGPFYILQKPYHLCGLEIPKTIRRALSGRPPLLTNGAGPPTVVVHAIAKRDLNPGEMISRAMGSFSLRGEAILRSDAGDAVPIGIIFDAVITKHVRAGSPLQWTDFEMPQTQASQLTKRLMKGIPGTCA